MLNIQTAVFQGFLEWTLQPKNNACNVWSTAKKLLRQNANANLAGSGATETMCITNSVFIIYYAAASLNCCGHAEAQSHVEDSSVINSLFHLKLCSLGLT